MLSREGNLDEIKAAAEAVKNQTKVAAPAGMRNRKSTR